MAQQNTKTDIFLSNLLKIASGDMFNLSSELSKHFHGFFLRCPSSAIFRQRVCQVILWIDILKNEPYNVQYDRVMKIQEVFLSRCSYMKEKASEGFWNEIVESELDRRLLEASLFVVCQIVPDKHVDIIKAIYGMHKPDNEFAAFVGKQLKSRIEDHPRLVLSWINNFELHSFKLDNFKQLLLTCLVKNLDITKNLMTDKESHRLAVSIIDSYVPHDVTASTDLENQFLSIFSDKSKISALANKHAKPDYYQYIPNTMKQRIISNFIYASRGLNDNEYRPLALQTLTASISPECTMELLRIISQRRIKLAIALTKFVKLTDDQILGSIPNYNDMVNSIQAEIKKEYRALTELKKATQKPQVLELDCDKFRCFLINDKDKFRAFLKELAYKAPSPLGFDIEAAYVCQSSDSSQKAVLLQIADLQKADLQKVWLVDIYALTDIISLGDWEVFFTIYFRFWHVGFAVNNDLNFLINAFPFLAEFIKARKPRFFDVQRMVNRLCDNPEALRVLFNNHRPQSSLKYVTQSLLSEVLEKEDQSSNWCNRPLTESQMKYAARDAYYTLKCYQQLKSRYVHAYGKENWRIFQNAAFKEPSITSTEPDSNRKKKETFEDVCEVLKPVCEEVASSHSEPVDASQIIIVLDKAFLGYRITLRRCGFQTWDHRDVDTNPAKNSRRMNEEMLGYLRRLEPETLKNTYVLTNQKTFYLDSVVFENRIITASQESSHSTMLAKIVRETRAAVDFSKTSLRCTKCFSPDTHVHIPMAAYRLLYKSFATADGFADKISGLEVPIQEFLKDFDSLDESKRSNCHVNRTDQTLTILVGDESFSFPINEQDKKVFLKNGSLMGFKCDTKLFENKHHRDEVKFCPKCCVFF